MASGIWVVGEGIGVGFMFTTGSDIEVCVGALPIEVFASFTASALHENLRSAGAFLLSFIVNPFVFLFVTK